MKKKIKKKKYLKLTSVYLYFLKLLKNSSQNANTRARREARVNKKLRVDTNVF
jgi:hypothetical protein